MASTSRWRLGRYEAVSEAGVVAAKTPLAAEFGSRVLQNGGNAVDAAVVTAAVAGVVEPWMNGLGGGGFLVRHDSKRGESSVVSYPMVAPQSATPDVSLSGGKPDAELFGWPSVVGGANLLGSTSICVPGTVAGLALSLQKYGTYSFAEALNPAIDLAREGFPVSWHTSMEIARDLANLRKFEATEALLCPNGIVPWSASQDNPTLLKPTRERCHWEEERCGGFELRRWPDHRRSPSRAPRHREREVDRRIQGFGERVGSVFLERQRQPGYGTRHTDRSRTEEIRSSNDRGPAKRSASVCHH